MASNYHAGGSGNDIVTFLKPVNHLNINVGAGVTFQISFNGGDNYLTIPAGFYSFDVGLVTQIVINATGAWQLVAVQG